MSVQIQTVEFERREAYLSELDDGAPWTVHGVALGAGDVTVGQSGIKKLWPASALKESAESLEGRNLVVDHNNDSSGVVGTVTKAGYKENVGVIYEAELFDEDLAEKINNGLLEVSIRGKHIDVESMEENEEGAKIVEGIKFDNLSIVPTGAAPSNTIDMGSTEELSVAELAEFTGELDSSELAQVEPGMWVTDGDMHGVTVSAVTDGEIEVDIYEEMDDKWRSTGETKMVSTDSLNEWDVDEDDIGAAKDDEEDDEENQSSLAAEGDKVQWDNGSAKGVIVDRKTDGCFSDRIDGDQEICADDDDPVALIEIVKDGDRTGTMVAHKESTLNSSDFEMSESKSDGFSDGMMVQWQVNPNMFGKIVHIDDDEGKIMVEVMEMVDGEPETTNHTVSAGFSDLVPMEAESMSEQLEEFSDYPEAASENAQMALDAREGNDNPNDCGTDVGWKRAKQLANGESLTREQVGKMSAFNRHRQNSEMDDDEGKADCGWMMWKAWGGDEGVDWAMDKMDEIEEEAAELRIEGEEEEGDEQAIREQSPERFIDPDEEELQDYEMHTPDWSGMTEGEWNSPDMEDFDTDDLSEISSHFLISSTGFPPENFGDLKLPVVEPNGDLNVNALSAVKGGRGVSAVDGLSESMEEDIVDWVNETANSEFERNWGEEEASVHGKRNRTIDDTGQEETVDDTGPVEVALNLINKYLRLEGKHERDSVDKMLSWIFGSTDLPMETVSDFRSASNQFLDQTAGTDSFDGLTIEQFRDWLLMHGGGSQGRREQDTQKRGELPPGKATPVHVLSGDDLQRMNSKSGESELDDTTKVNTMTNEEIEQKLAELSEPVAVEQSDLEELQDKADRFEEMSETLDSLKERTDVLDEADREQVEELAESDEPVVVESARMEQLESEAEQVKTVYAGALSDELSAFSAEELADKFSIEELREKYEEQIGDPAEELATSEEADPASGDVDEEELEERADEGSETEEASESDEAEEKRAELRSKILGGD